MFDVVDNAWLNCKVTTFDDCFNFHFVPHRNIAQPRQVTMNWAFLRTSLYWSAKLIYIERLAQICLQIIPTMAFEEST